MSNFRLYLLYKIDKMILKFLWKCKARVQNNFIYSSVVQTVCRGTLVCRKKNLKFLKIGGFLESYRFELITDN